MPIRWMAPECIMDAKFDSKGSLCYYYSVSMCGTVSMCLRYLTGDVWSFGVVLWELFSFGQVPYAAMSGDDVLQYVVMGHRLGRPALCPEIVYELMLRCWSAIRPSFTSCNEIMLMLAAGVHLTALPKMELADKNAAMLLDSTSSPTTDPPISSAEHIFDTLSDARVSSSPHHRNHGPAGGDERTGSPACR